MPHFESDIIYDPQALHHGFKSWDDYFTRQDRLGVRLIASLEDEDVITNAYKVAPYRLAHNIKAHDTV